MWFSCIASIWTAVLWCIILCLYRFKGQRKMLLDQHTANVRLHNIWGSAKNVIQERVYYEETMHRTEAKTMQESWQWSWCHPPKELILTFLSCEASDLLCPAILPFVTLYSGHVEAAPCICWVPLVRGASLLWKHALWYHEHCVAPLSLSMVLEWCCHLKNRHASITGNRSIGEAKVVWKNGVLGPIDTCHQTAWSTPCFKREYSCTGS